MKNKLIPTLLLLGIILVTQSCVTFSPGSRAGFIIPDNDRVRDQAAKGQTKTKANATTNATKKQKTPLPNDSAFVQQENWSPPGNKNITAADNPKPADPVGNKLERNKQTNNTQPTITRKSDSQPGLVPVISFINGYPAIQSLVILLLALFAGRLIGAVLNRAQGRPATHPRSQWINEVITPLRRPLYLSVVLFGALIAMLPWELSSAVKDVLHSVIGTLFIIIWSGFLLKISRIVLRNMSQASHAQSLVRPQTRPLFENLGFILTLFIAAYFIFRVWGIDMTAWLVSLGIAGSAIGLAARDTLGNLFAGMFILAETPYKLGDYVVLDSGERGRITAIGLRSTRLLTRDDVEVTIPNAIMSNSRIINESGGPYEKFRIRVKVGVAYGSDIDQVKAILMDVATNETQVCTAPEPRVRFRTFGNSSYDLELLCWVNTPEERGRVLDTLNTSIYKRFNEQGVKIPYSKHDVYIKEMLK